jgi:pyroglutamyl-peptidase
MRQPRLLITGFGPFPGAPENVSAWLVETLAATKLSSRLGCELHAHVLPTGWAEVRTLGPNLLQRHEPRLILHFGLSSRASGFRIERSAHNRVGAKDDARGARHAPGVILEHGQERLDTELPLASLAKHLREQGIPAATSGSAGSYLCNFLYYLSLDWAGRQATRSDVAFVHIPTGPRQGGPLSEAELLRGADAILRYLLAHAAEHDGTRPSERPGSIERAKHRSYAGRE